MQKIYTCPSLNEIREVAAKILTECTESIIFALKGDLGAGKTTLIKAMCYHLGYTEDVTSPTFSLVNHYKTVDYDIFHMDLYRLKDEDEALEMGIEEYLYSGGYCFIEWPQVVIPLIDEDYYMVTITSDDMYHRKIAVEKMSISI